MNGNGQILGLPVERPQHRHNGPGALLCMALRTSLPVIPLPSLHLPTEPHHPRCNVLTPVTPIPTNHTMPHTCIYEQLRIDPPYTRADIKTLDASVKQDFIDRIGNMVRGAFFMPGGCAHRNVPPPAFERFMGLAAHDATQHARCADSHSPVSHLDQLEKVGKKFPGGAAAPK